MPPPIHLPDGTYPLPPGRELVFDLNEGQDTVSVTNDNEHGNGSFTLSIDHSRPAPHALEPGGVFNLVDQEAGTHFHIMNNGQVALEVDIA